MNLLIALSITNDFFEKNLFSILSTIISLTAIIFSYLNTRENIKSSERNLNKQLLAQKENLDKQIQTQLKTTIDKEWSEQLRKVISEIIYQSTIITAHTLHLKLSDKYVDTVNDSMRILTQKTCEAKLLLSDRNEDELILRSIIEVFHTEISKSDKAEIGKIILYSEEIISITHKLIVTRRRDK